MMKEFMLNFGLSIKGNPIREYFDTLESMESVYAQCEKNYRRGLVPTLPRKFRLIDPAQGLYMGM